MKAAPQARVTANRRPSSKTVFRNMRLQKRRETDPAPRPGPRRPILNTSNTLSRQNTPIPTVGRRHTRLAQGSCRHCKCRVGPGEEHQYHVTCFMMTAAGGWQGWTALTWHGRLRGAASQPLDVRESTAPCFLACRWLAELTCARTRGADWR